MPALTGRRYPEHQDCWHVYYGEVHVGTIARRTGCPVDVDRYEWRCGFYPGIEPNRQRNDTARLRGRSRWLRSRLARDSADADRPRIPAVKRPPRLHSLEICHVGRRHEDADAIPPAGGRDATVAQF